MIGELNSTPNSKTVRLGRGEGRGLLICLRARYVREDGKARVSATFPCKCRWVSAGGSEIDGSLSMQSTTRWVREGGRSGNGVPFALVLRYEREGGRVYVEGT